MRWADLERTWARRRRWWLPGWLALSRWFRPLNSRVKHHTPDPWKAGMPLRDYTCSDCEHTTEEVVSRPPPKTAACEACGMPAYLTPVLARIARTPNRWGDALGGVNGHYDVGLGATYQNSQERERLIKARKVVPASDLPTHFIADRREKIIAENAAMDDFVDDYKAAAAVHGEERAMEQVLPAHDCLNDTGHAATLKAAAKE